MAIKKAEQFILSLLKNEISIKSLYTVKSKQELNEELEKMDYSFSYAEFDEAHNHLLVMCQTQEEAYKLKEIVNVYNMILFSLK
jgi:hypothetical protein